ncbi:MAG: NADH-ubiquinone oxidoreductase-F iron-sulfur binding region domain-containing protein [Dehalococcoidia bacterium]|nr:NADH-ubiquinone oxidoreductase-F iron-sulfur binding region domain-containing protein [Dehalococcoidia bacterium]
MPTPFEELQARAARRWEELTAGENAWIRVGGGTSGQAVGADAVFDAFKTHVESSGAKANVSMVGALGLMYMEPQVDVLMPDGSRIYYGNVRPEEAATIVEQHVMNGEPLLDRAFACSGGDGLKTGGLPTLESMPMVASQTRIATRNFGDIDPHDLLQYVANDGYSGLNKALTEMTPEEIVEEVKNSGLRGRGGAAFPAGLKWSFLAPSTAPVKYVLCNCEEGDPGAFNDKGIIEADPHTLIEGLIINGYATRSTHGYVFIRQGHEFPINAARKAIEAAYEAGLLGQNILGTDFSFEMEVSLTGDSYVAGEETALMEAIEGKRSTPRFKPPFPAAAGLWQKPTNINNVKTIAYVPELVRNGSEWFKGIGTETTSGTAIVCLSGHIKYPGMYEVPMGMTIRDVLETIGGGVSEGERIKVLQAGGPLNGLLGEEAFDTMIDFDAMSAAGASIGSGGIIVGNETTNVVDMLRTLVAFNQFESCGKCFPCRLGNTHMLEILDRMCKNKAKPADLALLQRVGNCMKAGSFCGHGQLGYNPIASALKYFGDEIKSCLDGELELTGVFGGGTMILPTRTRP